jgi:hypothetical protein
MVTQLEMPSVYWDPSIDIRQTGESQKNENRARCQERVGIFCESSANLVEF